MNDTMSPVQLQALRNSGTHFILIDTRRDADFVADPLIIPGAIRRPAENVDSWANELPLNVPVVVYCVRGGSVSQSVVPALRQKGLDAAYVVGGITAWKQQGGEVK